MVSPGCGPQHHLLGWSYPSSVASHLDNPGFNSSPLDAFFDFPNVERSYDVWRNVTKGAGDRQVVASGGNYLDATHPGYLLNHLHIPAQVKGAHIHHGPEPFVVGFLQCGSRLLDYASAVDEFRIGMAKTGCVGAHV